MISAMSPVKNRDSEVWLPTRSAVPVGSVPRLPMVPAVLSDQIADDAPLICTPTASHDPAVAVMLETELAPPQTSTRPPASTMISSPPEVTLAIAAVDDGRITTNHVFGWVRVVIVASR